MYRITGANSSYHTVAPFGTEENAAVLYRDWRLSYLEEQLLTGRSVVGRISYGDLPVEVSYLVE